MGDQQYSGLQQFPWQVLRATAAENGAAAITILTGMTYHEQKANCIDLHAFFGDKFTSLIVRMFGTSFGAETCADDDAFGFDLIGYRMGAGSGDAGSATGFNPPIQICSAAAGTAVCSKARASGDGGTTNLGRWVDAITVSKDDWPNGINKYGNGAETIMELEFLSNGLRYIYPYVHGALGANAGEAPAVGMIISAY